MALQLGNPGVQFLDSWNAYNTYDGNYKNLDPLRMIQASEQFRSCIYCLPGSDVVTIPARGTFEDVLMLATGSIITGISQWSDQVEGFKFTLYDTGAQCDVIYRTMIRNTMFGTMIDPATGLPPTNTPVSPRLIQGYLITTPPGTIQVRIVNMATVAARLQLSFDVAVPINFTTLAQQTIDR